MIRPPGVAGGKRTTSSMWWWQWATLSRTDIRDVDAADASIEAPLMDVRRGIMLLSVVCAWPQRASGLWLRIAPSGSVHVSRRSGVMVYE
jgi:hypothetical protein